MTFGRKAYERQPRQPLMIPEVPPEPKAVISRADGGSGAVEKFDYVRSKPLMDVYRRLPCQWCGHTVGVVGAHSNWAEHGKGRSVKASDIYCASLCFACHADLDSGRSMDADERRHLWDVAHMRTMNALIALSWEPGEHKLRALLTKVGIVKP